MNNHYDVKFSKKFRKSYKRVSSSKKFDIDLFNHVLELFESGLILPQNLKDHALIGDHGGTRECHLASDCLLIYEIDHENKYVRFVDIGNHSNLFE